MLYQLVEFQNAAFTPLRLFAETMRTVYSHPWMPVSYTRLGRTIAAGAELVERTTRRYGKPRFGIDHTLVDGRTVPVGDVAVRTLPFCTLRHFRRDGIPAGTHPRLLVVAPLSGHWATLLRGTVATLLPDHDVYITDWHDSRDVPQRDGAFGLDDYVDYLLDFIAVLGPGTHVLAVCQPAVPVMEAVSLLAADDDPLQPASMILMGGPIDTRINPTKVNRLATGRSLSWFERTVIHSVPFNHPGHGRRVYPGFLQLQGFVSLNLERHVGEHLDLFNNLVRGDGDSAAQHRKFYDEYLSVMDLPAEYYLDTIRSVFQDHDLARGRMTWRGRAIEPERIEKTALMTIEGERDDITGIGQTEAAHRLCSGLPAAMRRHHLQPKVGHYGVFNGRRWREGVYPHVRDFIRTHQSRVLANQDAGGHDRRGMGSVMRRLRQVLPA